MPLSEHEQRLLEQMEKALYAEDPKFATSLQSRGGMVRRLRRRRSHHSQPRRPHTRRLDHRRYR